MAADGTSKLTEEQQAQMLAKYGVRYTHVQDGSQGVGTNRKQRRKARRK